MALIIGPFFSGRMRPDASVEGRAQMLSNMRYHTSVIISLFGSLGTLGASSRWGLSRPRLALSRPAPVLAVGHRLCWAGGPAL